MPKPTLKGNKWVLGAIGCAVVVALWQLASLTAGEYFLPKPTDVWKELSVQARDPAFIHNIRISYERVIYGWLLGSAAGVGLGVMMGRYKPVFWFFYSPMQFFRVIPSVALVPALVFMLGVGETIKIIIIGYGVALVVALSISDSVHHVSQVRLQAARSMGAGGLRLFWGVLIPSVMPEILKAVRTSLAFAFMGIVGIEMLSAQDGVGRMIWGARTVHNLSLALLGILSLGLMGIVADFVIKVLFRTTARRFLIRG
jgi:ABC-type nitrate/sulfonate/bicarbonate transport system permease component